MGSLYCWRQSSVQRRTDVSRRMKMQPELQPIQTGNSIPARDYALQQHRVLRNTYWLLALSLIPTVIGAAIGTNLDFGFMRASPALSFFVILAIFYGWIFAIERNRNSSLGVGLLLGFTLFMGLMLGPLFQFVLGFKNGVQLVMMATGGTAAVFFVLTVLGGFILFSSAAILWQVNAIVRGGETNYVSATLTLYVSLWNMFSAL